jgi:hypothetical protein
MNKLDRFNEDYKKLEGVEKQIKEFLKERAHNVKMGQTTGKVRFVSRSNGLIHSITG